MVLERLLISECSQQPTRARVDGCKAHAQVSDRSKWLKRAVMPKDSLVGREHTYVS